MNELKEFLNVLKLAQTNETTSDSLISCIENEDISIKELLSLLDFIELFFDTCLVSNAFSNELTNAILTLRNVIKKAEQ